MAGKCIKGYNSRASPIIQNPNLLNLRLQLLHASMPIHPVRNIISEAVSHQPLPVGFFYTIGFTESGKCMSATVGSVVTQHAVLHHSVNADLQQNRLHISSVLVVPLSAQEAHSPCGAISTGGTVGICPSAGNLSHQRQDRGMNGHDPVSPRICLQSPRENMPCRSCILCFLFSHQTSVKPGLKPGYSRMSET